MITIREAVPGDEQAIARVHVTSWHTTYRGIIHDAYLDGLSVDDRAAVWSRQLNDASVLPCAFVGEDDEHGIIGFALGGRERDGLHGYDGELYAIYLLKEAQGNGTGTALFNAVYQRLAEAGFRSMLIWVLADNPSRRFYEARGGIEVAHQETVIGGVPYQEVGYGWQLGDDGQRTADGGGKQQ